MKMLFLIPLIFFMSVANAKPLNILSVNTEFFWDDKPPHSGRLIPSKIAAPTSAEYQHEARYYLDLILKTNADIVGLTEIEGCHIAQTLSSALTKLSRKQWYVACQKTRDSYTGQHVAILSSKPLIENTITTFPSIHQTLNGKKIRPSKIVGAVTRVDNDGHQYIVIATHLISKRGGSKNDAKRVAQASSVAKSRDALQRQYPHAHAIIMGDLNDTPASATLKTIVRGRNQQHLTNTASTDDCSYTYKGQCQLIDHILVSAHLRGGEMKDIQVPKNISDHRALLYRLP